MIKHCGIICTSERLHRFTHTLDLLHEQVDARVFHVPNAQTHSTSNANTRDRSFGMAGYMITIALSLFDTVPVHSLEHNTRRFNRHKRGLEFLYQHPGIPKCCKLLERPFLPSWIFAMLPESRYPAMFFFTKFGKKRSTKNN